MNFSAKMLRDEALANKVIVVTGGGSGLGKAMTRYFLELGARVAITSRNLEKLEKTAEELQLETGGNCLAVACDVRHYDQVEAMLADIVNFCCNAVRIWRDHNDGILDTPQTVRTRITL